MASNGQIYRRHERDGIRYAGIELRGVGAERRCREPRTVVNCLFWPEESTWWGKELDRGKGREEVFT
jgi:hypothetical protein